MSDESPKVPQSAPNPETKPQRRTRTSRKRTKFAKAPSPAWPVRGLWEAAPAEEKERAHETCMRILEYWLGKKSKAEIASEMEVSGLRVWQLSQQALAGMMAGLLRQPRRKVGPEAFQRTRGESPSALKKRIGELELKLSRTEDLVRVLRTAPWASPSSESPAKGGASHAGRKRTSPKRSRKKTGDTSRGRSAAPAKEALEGGAGDAG